jgi:hypothetical protein
LELKAAKHWKINLRPEQVAWHMQRSRVGGRTFIAVRRQNEKHDELHLIAGLHAAFLKENGLERTSDIYWEGGPRAWNWLRIESILLE